MVRAAAMTACGTRARRRAIQVRFVVGFAAPNRVVAHDEVCAEDTVSRDEVDVLRKQLEAAEARAERAEAKEQLRKRARGCVASPLLH